LLLTVLAAGPTISSIANQNVPVNGSAGPISFTIGDADSPVSTLTVSGASSNPNIVPNANIVFGGSDSNRTVTISPAPGKSGLTTITVTVADATGLSTSEDFTLTVASHSPGTFVWNGPGAGLNNWSTSGNWSPSGPPETLDDVKF